MGRLLIASLIFLPLFCGLLGLSLDRAFSTSLRSGAQAQLKLQAYALIAAAELNQQQLWLPEQLTEDRLNQPSSDLFAVVFSSSQSLPTWRSPSAINRPLPRNWLPSPLPAGQFDFGEIANSESHNNQEHLFYLQYSVYWEDETGHEYPFQFVIFETQATINQQISSYRKSLWGWLAAIALSITVIQVLILRWGLKPVRQVTDDLERIQTGQLSRLDGRYPAELEAMTRGINTLLNNEAQQRERYQNTLSDLAHSLKTPLAIMQGSLQPTEARDASSSNTEGLKEIEEQINRVDQIIGYQLKRAISAPANPFALAIPVQEYCEKVISALQKVYREKQVGVEFVCTDSPRFRGDKGDLMEILGNLLDNAFKYGNGEVRITALPVTPNGLSLTIEDNGPGIVTTQRTQLLQRGERADTSQPGQGIGLAVVTDIVSSYRGSIELTRSPMGGLSVTLQLP